MAIAQSKVTAQGQISVPAEIRRRLGIGPGSVLTWEQSGEDIVIRRAGTFTSQEIHQAIFATPPRPRSLAELKQGPALYVKRRHARR